MRFWTPVREAVERLDEQGRNEPLTTAAAHMAPAARDAFLKSLVSTKSVTAGDLESDDIARDLAALPARKRDAVMFGILDWLLELEGRRSAPPPPPPKLIAPPPPLELPPEDRVAAEDWAQAHGLFRYLDESLHLIYRSKPRLPRHPYQYEMTLGDLFVPVRSRGGRSTQQAEVVLRTAVREMMAIASGHMAGRRDARTAFLARAIEPQTPQEQRFDAALAALAERFATRSTARLEMIGHPAEVSHFLDRASPAISVDFAPIREEMPRQGLVNLVPLLGESTDRAVEVLSAGDLRTEIAIRHAVVTVVRDVLRDPESKAGQTLRAWLAVPTWRRALDRLGSPRKEEANLQAERLAFRVRVERGAIQVDVLAQSLRKNGDYTLGRTIDPQRGMELADGPLEVRLIDESIAVDRAATRDAQARGMARLLGLLADHPRVWMGASGVRPARIRRGRVSLALERQEGGFGVVFSIAGNTQTAAEVLKNIYPGGVLLVLDEKSAQVTVGTVDEVTIGVLSTLAEIPATFPEEAIDPLLGVLLQGQRDIDVTLPDELLGRAVEAETRPVVRLDPLPHGGLHLTVGVRPIPEGAFVEPGAGAPRALGARDGVRISAHRRLDEERTRAEALLAILPLGGAERDGPWNARIDDSDHAADTVVALSEAGDQVAVEWPDGGAMTVVTAGRKNLRLRIDRRHDWFGVEGDVEIDGSRVALASLLAAARAGHRFVRVDSKRIVALAHDLRERLRAADDALMPGEKGELRAYAQAIPALDDLVDDQKQIKAVAAWSTLRKRLRESSTFEAPLPAELKAELRPYQREGFQWMARLATWGTGGCLADDMGLGKTVQALALLLHRAKEGPALVVAPTTVGANWMVEAARFAPSLRVVSYRGPNRHLMRGDLAPGTVLVTSYDVLVRDAEVLAATSFATLVLDEAQALKNAASRRATAARSLQAEFRIALSGTPIENHIGELWSLFRIVSPGLLGSWDRFRERFAIPIERDRDQERRSALARLLRPFLLRRTKAAVAPELPPRTETVRLVELSPAERELYEIERMTALTAGADVAAPEQRRFAMLAALTRLRRLACHPRLGNPESTVASSKLTAFLEVESELREAGHRALVFSQFTSHLALVREALDARGVRYAYLDGDTPAADRALRIASFQAGEGDLFLLSLKAGGTGVNLTGADYVVHLDPWWNPAAEDQATDRAHRIGQTKSVTVIRLVARGTIEEAVLELHAEKRELAASLLSGTDAAGSLSMAELIALVRAGEGREVDDPPPTNAPAP